MVELSLGGDWRGQLAAFLELGSEAPARAVELAAAEVWGNVREEAPVDHGRLAGSFQLEQLGELTWRIVSGVEYALAVHEGTDGPIRPRSASVLRFEVGGQVVYAQEVAARAPNPYGDRAVARSEARVDDFIAAALDGS